MKISKGRWLLILGIVLVVIDQVIKILVKTNMSIGEHFSVIGNWFQILFIENEGMAFGMKFGGMVGKFLLTTFRICLFGFLCWWITGLVRRGYCTGKDSEGNKTYIKVPTGVLAGLTIITAGALGNIIDCLAYGQLFSESTRTDVASFGGSYAPVMFGKVVDMFYFPLIDTVWPDWMPVIGGRPFRFFEPVFNFADSCVTVGAAYLILFQYKFFTTEAEGKVTDSNKKKQAK